MSEAFDRAVEKVRERVGGKSVDGRFKFVVEDEGSVLIDNGAVSVDDGEADVTMTASLETFRAMMDGELDPTAAFMGGQLQVEGDMGQAMKLAELLD